jgi:ABC-type nickel/cobalt efflux system permease component RcnA
VKGIPSWVTYTVLRLLVFVIPLAVLLVLHVEPWIAVVAAALIGLCLSYIFLRKPRDAVATDLYAVRHRDKPATTVDDDVEDAAIDSAELSAEHSMERPAERPKPHDTTA